MHADIAIAIVETDNHVLGFNALQHSVRGFPVGQVIVFSDRPEAWPGFDVVRIPTLSRMQEYNRIITRDIAEHLRCDHVIVMQFDGFIINPDQFAALFKQYDYLGAPWPNFAEHNVGNGGFSMRSRRLVEAVAKLPYPDMDEAEDIHICRSIRTELETLSLRFAPAAIASHFSVEYPAVPWPTFGFHGIFNLPQVYRETLDFLIDNLSDRIVLSRFEYLIRGITGISPRAGERLRARYAAAEACSKA